mgnify:CR=1 FL=1
MKIFVTGGAGFIGSHLTEKLVNENHEVAAFDNLTSGKLEFLEHLNSRKNFRFIKGDLTNLETVKAALRGYEFVYHLAANPDIRKGSVETDLDLRLGTIATYNVLEAMRLNGVKKIAFSSSSVVYGEATVIPTPEEYGPMFPTSLYAASKLASEGLITAYCHTFDFQCWLFRFANIIGPNATHGVIYDFIHKLNKNPRELEILGDGEQRKSYLHVVDCVNAMVHLVSHANDKINVYNLGTEDSITVRRIAELIVEIFGLENVNFRFTGTPRGWAGDIPRMRLSIEKLKRTGFYPARNSEKAVIDTL